MIKIEISDIKEIEISLFQKLRKSLFQIKILIEISLFEIEIYLFIQK